MFVYTRCTIYDYSTGFVSNCMHPLYLFWRNITRPLPFSDKRSVPPCYHGGNISTLDSDSDAHRSRRNKWLKPWQPSAIFLFAGIYFLSVHAICEKWSAKIKGKNSDFSIKYEQNPLNTLLLEFFARQRNLANFGFISWQLNVILNWSVNTSQIMVFIA